MIYICAFKQAHATVMTRIFLIGYMGAGKTTLGKALARKLNMPFVDLDWYIEERFYKTVRELFVERGEDSFRQLERQMLHEVSDFENVIISTGGGTPCFFDNMDFMNEKGETIFLDVDINTLHRRLIVAKQSRPLLKDKSDEELLKFIKNGVEGRKIHYNKAKYTLNATELESRKQISSTIQKLRELIRI